MEVVLLKRRKHRFSFGVLRLSKFQINYHIYWTQVCLLFFNGPNLYFRKTETLRINQADIAALVAGSLGAAFPSNSVGMFPTQIWNDSSSAYGILRANFLQVLELTRTKKYLVAIERNFQLIEFPREAMLMEMFMEAEKLAKEGKQENAVSY